MLMAMDYQWWKRYANEVHREFTGDLRTTSAMAAPFGVKVLKAPFSTYGNSGAVALALAADKGAKRIVMLGYDCQRTARKSHWHGDHPKGLGNAGSMGDWPEMFGKMSAALPGVQIINASRETALRCFSRETLESALCDPS